MANNYVATHLPVVLYQLSRFTRDQHLVSPNLAEKPFTADALLRNQTAEMIPGYRREGSNNFVCTDFKIVYMVANQTSIGTGSALADDPCTLVADTDATGLAVNYTLDTQFKRTVSVAGKDCDSAIKFTERLTTQMMLAMHDIALEINQAAIAALLANTQVVAAGNGGAYGTVNAGVVEYQNSDILDVSKWQSILSDFAFVAQQNKVLSPIVMHGNNFASQLVNAGFNAANDNTRSQMQAMLGINNNWDVHGFSAARANIALTSLLVDPNAYVFFASNYFPTTPMDWKDENSTTVFSLPLKYIAADGTAKTLQYKENGTMKDIMVDCRLQYKCNPSGTVLGHPVPDYIIEMKVVGDFKTMPATTPYTGIVRIDAV